MDVNIQELLNTLIQLVLLPALPILSAYAVKLLKKWIDEKTQKIDNEKAQEYLNSIGDTVCQVVMSTTQTYVDNLKGQNAFDSVAQKKAFELTKTTVLNLLTTEAKDFLAKAYGDVDAWLDSKIEQTVQDTKKPKKAA